MLHPWIPESAEKLLDALGAPELDLAGARMQAGRLGAIAKLEPLFPKPQTLPRRELARGRRKRPRAGVAR